MNEGGTERFAVLLDLAKTIAENSKPRAMIIIRTPEGNWLVTLRELAHVTEDDPLPRTGGAESLEKALEAFVISPHK
jgi:hypothetical protein